MNTLNSSIRFVIFFLLAIFWTIGSAVGQSRIIFSGGTVIDGSGGRRYEADIAVVGERIDMVGEIGTGPQDRIISVAGLIVAPGFIDLHNHSSQGILGEPAAASQVSQGITTLLLGPDGGSPFPTGHYLQRMEETPSAVNRGLMVGHGTVRSLIMGEDYKRHASAPEIEAMIALVKVGMDQGAFGLSSGLEYDPGFYSSTEELVALARISATAGGIYMSHIRDEEEGFVAALEEAVEIGRRAGVRVQISHLKLGNTNVWGRTEEALGILHKANAQGIDVQADAYPYDAWASGLSILVPSRKFDDPEEIRAGFKRVGGPEKVLITRYRHQPEFEFKTVAEISAQTKLSPEQLFIQMMENGGAGVVCQSMSQDDVHAFYRDPLVMVSSDGGIDSRHPRKAGTFPRVLGRFARDDGILSLEQAVHKMTRQPASRVGLSDRGLVAADQAADLVVFDPAAVIDRSTFQEPDLLPEGIRIVMVNGVIVWQDGKPSGETPGRVLRRRD